MKEPYRSAISDQFLPRLRAESAVVPRDGETTVYSPRVGSVEVIDDPDGIWAALLDACDGSRGVTAVWERLGTEGIKLSLADVADGVDALHAQGLLVDAAYDIDDEWSNQRAYLEQLSRGDLDVRAAHDRVRSTRVLVIGAGGIGSWLAMGLAMMGVASLMVVDPDLVEDRNRARQPYPSGSVGTRKVEALGELVTALRPGLEYAGVDLRVEQVSDLTSLVQGQDVVACCADEPTLDVVASLVAGAAVPAGVPHVICGSHGATGRVGPFWYPNRRPLPCAGCLSRHMSADDAEQRPERRPRRRERTAVSAAQAQLAAALGAGEILHFRAGVRPATAGRLFALDSLSLGSSRARVPLRDDCPICFGGRKGRARVSSVATL